MMPLLLLVFIAVPLIEIGLFIQVGGWIGLWPTLAIVLATAILGSTVLRSQGARALAEIGDAFGRLRDPTRPLAHGALLLLAGSLLLTPGFFTDTVGALLLVPRVREAVMTRIGRRLRARGSASFMRMREPHRPPYEAGVIDADFIVDPDPPPAPRGPSGWTRH